MLLDKKQQHLFKKYLIMMLFTSVILQLYCVTSLVKSWICSHRSFPTSNTWSHCGVAPIRLGIWTRWRTFNCGPCKVSMRKRFEHCVEFEMEFLLWHGVNKYKIPIYIDVFIKATVNCKIDQLNTVLCDDDVFVGHCPSERGALNQIGKNIAC